MMLPRNSTTEITCSDFRIRYCMSGFLTSLAFQPGGEARRVELVVLVQYRIDRVDAHGTAMIAQARVRPGAQLDPHAHLVQSARARDAHVVVDGLVHVVGEPRALAHLAVMRQVHVARPELHESHDGRLEL